MRHLVKRYLITIAILLSLMVSSMANTRLKFESPFVLTAFAATDTKRGGRWDITLGEHSSTVRVVATVNKKTRVQMWDKNWNSVWAGDISGTRVLECGSNVYYVTFYLDLDKVATVTW